MNSVRAGQRGAEDPWDGFRQSGVGKGGPKAGEGKEALITEVTVRAAER